MNRREIAKELLKRGEKVLAKEVLAINWNEEYWNDEIEVPKSIKVNYTLHAFDHWEDEEEDKKVLRPVRVFKLALERVNVDELGKNATGGLNIYFAEKDWDVNKKGHIYTDETFEKELKDALKKDGFAGVNEIGPSEGGMQHGDSVNYDVGEKFILSFFKKINFKVLPPK